MIFGASRPRRSRTPRPSRRGTSPPLVEDELPPKLLSSLRQLVSTAVGLAHTRLALAGVELEEEIQRLLGAAVLALIALVLVLLALIVGTFTIVAAVPPEYRVVTMIAINNTGFSNAYVRSYTEPLSAISTALRRTFALFTVSSNSNAGMESATTPAPA